MVFRDRRRRTLVWKCRKFCENFLACEHTTLFLESVQNFAILEIIKIDNDPMQISRHESAGGTHWAQSSPLLIAHRQHTWSFSSQPVGSNLIK